MGQILDLLPSMYHRNENNLAPFIRALEPSLEHIERKIDDFTALTDVDRCPAEYLPYLAALTNVPLVGEDPRLWRRQIRNWPWLLKIKGTERSLAVFLQSIGAKEYVLYTWFRDANGDLVLDKPQGEPFLNQATGVWHNIRTHYFSIEMILDEEFLYLYKASQADLVEKVLPWMERTKPFHAELLSISIVPPNEEHDHICYHDVCHWSHGYLWTRDLGVGTISESNRIIPGIVDGGTHLRIFGAAAYEWSALYDSARFGDLPHAPIEGVMRLLIRGVVGFNDAGHSHRWHKERSWECGGTWEDDCCQTEISGTTLTFARSTAVLGYGEDVGSLNCCYSGGYERVVPYVGAFGDTAYSGIESNGAFCRSIPEFSEKIERSLMRRQFFEKDIEEVINWES